MKMNRANLLALAKLGQRGALLASALCLGGMAQAQTTYNVAGLADFTGPFADIMKDVTGCRRAVLDWWSEEVGKVQGVALRIKDFDTRYDVAQVASLWPGIKSELNPVAILGVGGADTNALQQRLPNDKVPLIQSTAGYGFAVRDAGGWRVPREKALAARPWAPGVTVEATIDDGTVIFDTTGLATPGQVILRQDGATSRISIDSSGAVRVDAG